jgi:hypothetical protein
MRSTTYIAIGRVGLIFAQSHHTSICSDLRPLRVCPEIFALYLHLRTRVWPRCVSVAFAGIFILTCSYKIFAISAFFVRFHIRFLSINTCFILSTYPVTPCLSRGRVCRGFALAGDGSEAIPAFAGTGLALCTAAVLHLRTYAFAHPPDQ